MSQEWVILSLKEPLRRFLRVIDVDWVTKGTFFLQAKIVYELKVKIIFGIRFLIIRDSIE